MENKERIAKNKAKRPTKAQIRELIKEAKQKANEFLHDLTIPCDVDAEEIGAVYEFIGPGSVNNMENLSKIIYKEIISTLPRIFEEKVKHFIDSNTFYFSIKQPRN